MILKDTRQTELSFFFFASFGAASLLALIVSFFVALLFSVFSTELSFSAGLWIFLFLFPAALAFSSSFIASKLKSVEMPNLIYTIIIGYGTYSIISLVILLLGARNEPALWAILILALISVALFNTETVLARLGMDEDASSSDGSQSQGLRIHSSVLPIKIASNPKEENDDTKPIFSIKKNLDSSEKQESAHVDVPGGRNNGVIHLGPRS